MASRGGEIDWLEDLYVKKEFQNQGIGTKAIQAVEQIVKAYSQSLYIEAASRNLKAIQLYHRLGYDCLNTITVRKDFQPSDFETIEKVTIGNQEFKIKKRKQKTSL